MVLTTASCPCSFETALRDIPAVAIAMSAPALQSLGRKTSASLIIGTTPTHGGLLVFIKYAVSLTS